MKTRFNPVDTQVDSMVDAMRKKLSYSKFHMSPFALIVASFAFVCDLSPIYSLFLAAQSIYVETLSLIIKVFVYAFCIDLIPLSIPLLILVAKEAKNKIVSYVLIIILILVSLGCQLSILYGSYSISIETLQEEMNSSNSVSSAESALDALSDSAETNIDAAQTSDVSVDLAVHYETTTLAASSLTVLTTIISIMVSFLASQLNKKYKLNLIKKFIDDMNSNINFLESQKIATDNLDDNDLTSDLDAKTSELKSKAIELRNIAHSVHFLYYQIQANDIEKIKRVKSLDLSFLDENI